MVAGGSVLSEHLQVPGIPALPSHDAGPGDSAAPRSRKAGQPRDASARGVWPRSHVLLSPAHSAHPRARHRRLARAHRGRGPLALSESPNACWSRARRISVEPVAAVSRHCHRGRHSLLRVPVVRACETRVAPSDAQLPLKNQGRWRSAGISAGTALGLLSASPALLQRFSSASPALFPAPLSLPPPPSVEFGRPNSREDRK